MSTASWMTYSVSNLFVICSIHTETHLRKYARMPQTDNKACTIRNKKCFCVLICTYCIFVRIWNSRDKRFNFLIWNELNCYFTLRPSKRATWNINTIINFYRLLNVHIYRSDGACLTKRNSGHIMPPLPHPFSRILIFRQCIPNKENTAELFSVRTMDLINLKSQRIYWW